MPNWKKRRKRLESRKKKNSMMRSFVWNETIPL